MSKQVQAISSLLGIAICIAMLLQPTVAHFAFPPLPPLTPFPFPPVGGGGRFPFPLPPFPFPPIGGGGRFPLPPFPFPPIGGGGRFPFPLPPFPPIGGGGRFPFPLPPFPFPLPPSGSRSYQIPISSSKVQQEQSNAPKCWSPLTKVEGCVPAIHWSITHGKIGNFGAACCHAIMEITEDCMSQIFPTIPSFPSLLKGICAKFGDIAPAPNVG